MNVKIIVRAKRLYFQGRNFLAKIAKAGHDLYMAQNPLSVLSFIGWLFDPNFFAAAAGPLMAANFQIVNLS